MVNFYNYAILHASLCQNGSRPLSVFPSFGPHHGIVSVQIYAQFWAKKLIIWAAGEAAATISDGLIISISSDDDDDDDDRDDSAPPAFVLVKKKAYNFHLTNTLLFFCYVYYSICST